ncbi:hypothetical protein [Streptomyces sp. gb14]|uniref:hypothetical protein n=1 Tax=Streptomyces sp. gb14 TaxID=1827753 RepID=UPI001C54CEE9|nr:hypothetical protein [Streptomyces sp. gb14]
MSPGRATELVRGCPRPGAAQGRVTFSPALGGILGACHSLDLPLAFATLGSPVGTQLIGEEPTPEAVALSRELQDAWVRFITTGDPGWSAHRPDAYLTRVLDADSRTLPYPEQASRTIWEGHHPAPFEHA